MRNDPAQVVALARGLLDAVADPDPRKQGVDLKATAIPPLDKTAPIALRKWKGHLVACTENELWLLEPADGQASLATVKDAPAR